MEWTGNQGVDHLAARFLMPASMKISSWKISNGVVNGKLFIRSDGTCFCIIQIVSCASEASVHQKQAASLVELNSSNVFRALQWGSKRVNWIWGIDHLPLEPRAACLWVQLKSPICWSLADLWWQPGTWSKRLSELTPDSPAGCPYHQAPPS